MYREGVEEVANIYIERGIENAICQKRGRGEGREKDK